MLARLKEIRISRGLTQQQLADQLGLKWGASVCYWEKQLRLPSLPQFAQLVKILNVSADELLQ